MWTATVTKWSIVVLVNLVFALGLASPIAQCEPATLSIATFQIDATPPIGTPLCHSFVAPAKAIDDPLSVRE